MVTVLVVRVSRQELYPRQESAPAVRAAELAFLEGMVGWVQSSLERFTSACGQYLVNEQLLRALARSDSAYCHSIGPSHFRDLVSACTKVPLASLDREHLGEHVVGAHVGATLACGALPWSPVVAALVQQDFAAQSRAMMFENGVLHVAIFHPRDRNTFMHLVWNERAHDMAIHLCKRGRYETHTSPADAAAAAVAAATREAGAGGDAAISEQDAEFVTSFVRAVVAKLLQLLPDSFGFRLA